MAILPIRIEVTQRGFNLLKGAAAGIAQVQQQAAASAAQAAKLTFVPKAGRWQREARPGERGRPFVKTAEAERAIGVEKFRQLPSTLGGVVQALGQAARAALPTLKVTNNLSQSFAALLRAANAVGRGLTWVGSTVGRVRGLFARLWTVVSGRAGTTLYQLAQALQASAAPAGQVTSKLNRLTAQLARLSTAASISPRALQRLNLQLGNLQASAVKARAGIVGTGKGLTALRRVLSNYIGTIKSVRTNLNRYVRQLGGPSRRATRQASRSQRELSRSTRKSRDELRNQWWQVRKNYMGFRPFSSALIGVNLGMQLLEGNIMGAIRTMAFAGRQIIPLVLAFTALSAAVIGTVRALQTFGPAAEQLRLQMKGLVGVQGDWAQAQDATIARSLKFGRAITDIAAAEQEVLFQGLALPGMFEAAMDMAAGMGFTGAEAMKMLTSAIGLNKASIETLLAVGIRLPRAIDEWTDRFAVAAAVMAAVRERFGGLGEEFARSTAGSMTIIREALSSVMRILVQPIWEEFFLPLIRAAADFAKTLIDVAKAIWKSKDVIDAWNETLEYARDILAGSREEMVALRRFVTMFMIGALKAAIWVVRILIFSFDMLGAMLWQVGRYFDYLQKRFKPTFDMLRQLSAYLKALDWRAVLTETKTWQIEFPSIIFTGVSLALAALGGLPSLAAFVIGQLGDLIIAMLPFEPAVRDALHRIWDIVQLGIVIASFFGWQGILIGIGVFALIGILDEKYKLGIRDWLIENLPEMFPYILAGGIIGRFFGTQWAAVGIGVALVIWALKKYNVEILEWFVGFADDLAFEISHIQAVWKTFLTPLVLETPAETERIRYEYYWSLRETMVAPLEDALEEARAQRVEIALEQDRLAGVIGEPGVPTVPDFWTDFWDKLNAGIANFLELDTSELGDVASDTTTSIFEGLTPTAEMEAELMSLGQGIFDKVMAVVPTTEEGRQLGVDAFSGLTGGLTAEKPSVDAVLEETKSSIISLLYDPLLTLDWQSVWQRITDSLLDWYGARRDDLVYLGERIAAAIREGVGDLTFAATIVPLSDVLAGVIGPVTGVADEQFGGAGVATRPTLFLAGERGAEAYSFSPIGRRGQGELAQGGVSIHVSVSGNTLVGTGGIEEVAELVSDRIMRKLGRSYSVAMVR